MAQLVERHLAKVEAAGSSPVSRSIIKIGSIAIAVLPILVIVHFKSKRDDLSRFIELAKRNRDVTLIPFRALFIQFFKDIQTDVLFCTLISVSRT